MKKLVCALLLLMMSSGVFAQTQTMSKTQERKERVAAVHEEFKKIVDAYYAAWNTGSTVQPSEYYAKDAELVFYDVAPLKYKSWKEYSAGVEKNFFQAATSVKLIPGDDLKVTRRGTITWTTLTFRLTAAMKDGKNLDLVCRHTAIWEKRGGRWLIVHEHVSAPLQ